MVTEELNKLINCKSKINLNRNFTKTIDNNRKKKYTYFSIKVNLSKISTKKLGAVTPSFFSLDLALFIIRYVKVKKEIDLKFSKSVYIAAGMLIYMTIINYINNMVLNILNVGVAIVYFFIVNKDNMKKIMNKTLKFKV